MPAAPGAPYDLAEVVFRVGRAYGMTADRGIYQAVAVKDGRITAVGRSRDELDSFIGPGTAASRARAPAIIVASPNLIRMSCRRPALAIRRLSPRMAHLDSLDSRSLSRA